jgi:hypothetical protein
MRLGERTNCMLNHTGSSCIFPIKGDGVHRQQTGSKKAIDTYQAVLKADPARPAIALVAQHRLHDAGAIP